ncbi:MAG TPA: hypothetical protein DD791_01915 [Syntrophomonas sp.]|nr:hypothetical protein [Syntrophomonas sp.]
MRHRAPASLNCLLHYFFLVGKDKGMKIRNLKNLPVFDRDSAQVIGRVEKAVVGDDFRLAYLVIEMTKGDGGPGMVVRQDIEIGEESVTINSPASIKSYAAGEELSVYQKKIGDTVFDREGKELGAISDFILSRDSMKVWGVEISSGAIKDILHGREGVPLEQINWRNRESAVLSDEGRNDDDYQVSGV